MGIRFACPLCARPLNIKSELAGRRGICPKCRGRIQIPLEDSPQTVPLQPAADSTQLSAVQETDMPARGKGHPTPAKTPHPPAPPETNGSESPLDDPDALWYVRPPAGGQYGPASSEVMRSWIAEYRITPSTLLWRQGWSQWRSAREALPDLLPVPSADPVMTQPTTSASASSDPAEPVILFGQAGIGQDRSVRSQRRQTLIVLLAVTSLVLIGVLAFLALR